MTTIRIVPYDSAQRAAILDLSLRVSDVLAVDLDLQCEGVGALIAAGRALAPEALPEEPADFGPVSST